MRTLGVLFLLLLCGLADSAKLVAVNPASFTLKDAEEECSSGQLGESSFSVMHIKGKCSPFRHPNSTWFNAISESIKGDTNRYQTIMKGRRRVMDKSNNNPQEDTDVPLASGQAANTGNYIIKLGFGTPGQTLYTTVDTGSDITWIPCTSCSDCSGQLFDPSKSPSFQYLSCASEACQQIPRKTPSCGKSNCNFTETYGDGSQLDQVLSSDTVAVVSQSVHNFIFGCAKSLRGFNPPTPGLVGFGRRPLSFISQTAKLYDTVFSYCLPSLRSSAFTGSLELGKNAISKPGLQFTPLLSNAANPSFYYVGLNGISVGQESVSVPPGTFTMDQSTGKGTIIDSGTVITRLVEPAYNAMRDSFRRQLSNLSLAAPYSIFDTCYNIPSGDVDVPQITLHFENSVDLVLTADNFFIPVKDDGSVACLAFALPPRNSTASVISIIGNYQQQNFRVVYDVPGSRLGVVSESCDK